MAKFIKSEARPDAEWHFIQEEEKNGSITYVTACKERIADTEPHLTATDGNAVQKDESPVCMSCGF